MNHTYAYTTVPSEYFSALVTQQNTKKTKFNFTVPLHLMRPGQDEKEVVLDSILTGLDLWYKLGKESNTEPENELIVIKTIMPFPDDLLTDELDFSFLAAIADREGESYSLSLDFHDKYAAACRALVLNNDESCIINQLTSKYAAELYLENYTALLRKELETCNAPKEPVANILTSINKVFKAQSLTQIQPPHAQDTIDAYIDYTEEFMTGLATSIAYLNARDSELPELPGMVMMENTAIAIRVDFAPALKYANYSLVKSWLENDPIAEIEILRLLGETNIKIAQLLCIESALKNILKKDGSDNMNYRLGTNILINRVKTWLKENNRECHDYIFQNL